MDIMALNLFSLLAYQMGQHVLYPDEPGRILPHPEGRKHRNDHQKTQNKTMNTKRCILLFLFLPAVWPAVAQPSLDECREMARNNYPAIRRYA